jgi:hypothetical protein
VLQSLSLRRPAARNGLKAAILVLAEGGDAPAPYSPPILEEFQFLQHLKKTNQAAIAHLE